MSDSSFRPLFDRLAQVASNTPAETASESAAQPPAPSAAEPPARAPIEPAPDPVSQAPAVAAGQAAERMGERFVRLGLLTEEQVQHVVRLQHTERLRFGQAAVRLGFVSEERVQAVLAEQYHYDYASNRQQNADLSLPIAAMPFSQEAEAIRQVRGELSIRLGGLPRFALAVIGTEEHEGCSYLAASLAIAFAQTGRRTLLVNADLRASGQHDLLGRGGGMGLSTVLAGRAGAQRARAVAGFPSLAVLDAGPQPPNPAELLREPALRKVLESYAGEYEIFIVNTPPTNHSSDAQSIARQVDACLLVARKDITLLADLDRAAQLLDTAGARVLGVVYNEYDPQAALGRSWRERVRAWIRR
ncbi:polysaccharide biosynthesis tyrosine autokinase [Bordetella avium]|uniref:Capsular polysaccharide biosynthesis protein n=1 Tax=Bordetella avium (strain 197N) TaxID=360910 RepID=Q2KWM1_BORA1|nr:polysaccharide biosynthesis tyrosine autokinase [Bordetella avium]CAJ50260.1 putative capsular polysaccharide biosynthesis protein [Bordetella avium 197N]